MIQCKVTGSAKDVLDVRGILQKHYGKLYSKSVEEQIPEAVAHGTSKCTAIFILNDKYIDLQMFNALYQPELEFRINDLIYCKGRRMSRGQWHSV